MAQIDTDASNTLKREKERFASNLKEQMSSDINYLKQQINETKEEHEQLTKEIKSQFKSSKKDYQQQLQK